MQGPRAGEILPGDTTENVNVNVNVTMTADVSVEEGRREGRFNECEMNGSNRRRSAMAEPAGWR